MINKNIINYLFLLCIGIFFFNPVCARIHKSYKKAEEFLLYDLNGKRFYLSAQKGNIVLLNFWSVQCAPCIKEMAELERLERFFKYGNGMVVGILCRPFEETLIRSIVENNKISYRNCIDVNDKIAQIYGVNKLPTTFIIDYDGYIRYKTAGYMRENSENYKKIISQLINERDNKKK
ncbi:MAG: TlpA disulfide reductase family protein [Chitinispirillia bacterium]|jgi:peroxiredoxin